MKKNICLLLFALVFFIPNVASAAIKQVTPDIDYGEDFHCDYRIHAINYGYGFAEEGNSVGYGFDMRINFYEDYDDKVQIIQDQGYKDRLVLIENKKTSFVSSYCTLNERCIFNESKSTFKPYTIIPSDKELLAAAKQSDGTYKCPNIYSVYHEDLLLEKNQHIINQIGGFNGPYLEIKIGGTAEKVEYVNKSGIHMNNAKFYRDSKGNVDNPDSLNLIYSENKKFNCAINKVDAPIRFTFNKNNKGVKQFCVKFSDSGNNSCVDVVEGKDLLIEKDNGDWDHYKFYITSSELNKIFQESNIYQEQFYLVLTDFSSTPRSYYHDNYYDLYITTDLNFASKHPYSNLNEDGDDCSDLIRLQDDINSGTVVTGCEVIPEVARKWINNILNFVRYVALALVIALGALDFMKAAGSGEPDAMKKAGQSFMKRMIAVVILFLLPVLVDFILNMINIYGVDPNNVDCL